MIFKVIIFITIALIIYRLLGGKVPIPNNLKKEQDNDFTKISPTVRCANCGTYITEDDAITYQKKSYCSDECLKCIRS
jgi:hypothetical protein